MKRNRCIQGIVLIALLAVFLELALQAFLFARQSFWPHAHPIKYRYDELSNYSLVPNYVKAKPNHISITTMGTRRTSDPIAGGKNIAVMGGSTTFCSRVSDNETWPYWLERILRNKNCPVNVINYGIPSQHANHHIARYARDVAPLRPVLSLFFLNVNDVEIFKVADLRGEERDYDTLKSVTGSLRRLPPTPFALVKLFRLVRDRVGSLLNRLRFESTYRHTLTERSARWEPDDGCVGHYRERIKKLIKLSKDAGSIPVFIIPPHIYRDYNRIEALCRMEKRIFYFENKNIYYWLGHLVNWRRKQAPEIEKAKGLGAEVVDLRDIFEEEISKNILNIKKFTDDGVHYTPQGNRRFAEQLARGLVNQNLTSYTK